jgi:hypothetical protein
LVCDKQQAVDLQLWNYFLFHPQEATMAITDDTQAVLVPDGFTLQPLATGLTFPTAITFSGDQIWVWTLSPTPTSEMPDHPIVDATAANGSVNDWLMA